jgi:hypothetical protein
MNIRMYLSGCWRQGRSGGGGGVCVAQSHSYIEMIIGTQKIDGFYPI